MVRDGIYYALALVVVGGAVAWLTGTWWWAVPLLLLAAFFLWFFRDPERKIPAGAGLVVSPADGKVTAIGRVSTLEGERLRLSIFLSVFDVHVNRAPVGGVIVSKEYREGVFLNAMNPRSASTNEQNVVEMESEDGHEVGFSQIAGLLARRIVFTKRTGDRLERGERVGLIKFGSRVDVFLPHKSSLRVKVGQRVKGGASVLAELPETERATIEILAEAELVGTP
jgi:phosphatidylserine decarboxylase